MSIALTISVVVCTLAAIAGLVGLVVRAELRREEAPRRRSRHDTAYGKGVAVTGAAAEAEAEADLNARRGEWVPDFGGSDGGGGD